jgi:hypothetical protein
MVTQPLPVTTCVGGSATFTAGASGLNLQYQWEINTSGNTYVNIVGATTSTYSIASVSLADATNYRVTVTGLCGSVTSNAVALTVNPLPVCSITGVNTICAGQTTSFQAAAGMSSYSWSGPGGFSATSQGTGNISVAGTYTVLLTNSNGCQSSCTRTLTLNPLPTATLTGGTFCATGSTTIAVSNIIGGPFTGASFAATPAGLSLTTSTGAINLATSTAGTYTITYSFTGANGCINTSTTSVTVNPLSTPVGISGASCGIGTVTIDANNCTGTLNWYAGSTGGSSLYAGRPFVTPVLNVTTTYYVSCTSLAGCEGPRVPVDAVIRPVDPGTIATSQIICEGAVPSQLTSVADGDGGSGVSISTQWQSSTNNGTTWTTIAGATSPTYTFPVGLLQTTWYRRMTRGVKSGSGGFDCTAASNIITIAVNSPASVIANPVTDAIGCVGDPTSITGSGTGTGSSYQWEMSTNNGSTWGNVPNAAPYSGTTSATLSISGITIAMSNYLYRLALVTPPPCSIVARSQDIHIKIRNVWMGYVSTDWNNGANWSDGLVPSYICDDVHILDQTRDPILSSNVGTQPIHNLILYTGASLTLLNGSTVIAPATGVKLQVRGHITKDPTATFSAITGTVEMNGGNLGRGGAQTIDANTFTNNALGNLIVNNNPPDLSLLGPLDIYESVEYGTSGTTLTTGNFLILKSLPGLTARMGVLTGKTINGQVTVERYLHARSSWRFLSVPTQGSGQTIHQAWQENKAPTVASTPGGYGTNITGPTFPADGFDEYSQRHSMKYFDPNAWDGYTVVANTGGVISQTTPLGYMVFVRGDRLVTNGAGATTLRTKGLLYRDGMSFTVDGSVGWNSVGNPYASRLNIKTIVKNNVTDAVTVWNPDLGGLYGVGGFETLIYNGTDYVKTPGSGIRNYIESGEAFYIQSTSTSNGTISISESDKRQGSSDVSFAPNREAELRVDMISSPGNEPDYLADGVLLNFSDRYSRDIDNNDVKKLSNSSNNLAVSSGDNYLVAERTAMPDHGDTIHLALYSTREQAYQFNFKPSNLQKLKVQPFLYDQYLQTYQPIPVDANSSINFTIASEAASKAMDRFKIVFRKIQKKNMLITDLAAGNKQDRTIGISWKVENEADVKQYEIERSGDGLMFTGIITTDPTGNTNTTVSYAQTDLGPLAKANYYRVKATENDGIILYSEVVKVDPAVQPPLSGGIRIYPNPVKGKLLQLELTNLPAGKYGIQIVSTLGQVTYQSVLHVKGDKKLEAIKLGSSLRAGEYIINISGPDGKLIRQSVFVE